MIIFRSKILINWNHNWLWSESLMLWTGRQQLQRQAINIPSNDWSCAEVIWINNGQGGMRWFIHRRRRLTRSREKLPLTLSSWFQLISLGIFQRLKYSPGPGVPLSMLWREEEILAVVENYNAISIPMQLPLFEWTRTFSSLFCGFVSRALF